MQSKTEGFGIRSALTLPRAKQQLGVEVFVLGVCAMAGEEEAAMGSGCKGKAYPSFTLWWQALLDKASLWLPCLAGDCYELKT